MTHQRASNFDNFLPLRDGESIYSFDGGEAFTSIRLPGPRDEVEMGCVSPRAKTSREGRCGNHDADCDQMHRQVYERHVEGVERAGAAKGRIRRIAIVALARKLMVALWRYLETGLIPEGAVMNAAS